MKTKKLLLMALFMLAAIGVKAQYITVFFWDTVGDFTNIRNAPNGKIVEIRLSPSRATRMPSPAISSTR